MGEQNKIENVIHLKSFIFQLFLFSLIVSQTALADPTSDKDTAQQTLLSKAAGEFDKTWQSTNYEIYIPINTWHNRSNYTDEQISKYNEQPWGIGIGKYRYDQDGDWHGLYAMVFLDSKSKWEPIVGYGFQKVWQPSEAVKLGLGYTVGMTLRNDLNYVPLPVIVPLVSIKYQAIAIQSTYVPGASGHVLFTWIRWEIR